MKFRKKSFGQETSKRTFDSQVQLLSGRHAKGFQLIGGDHLGKRLINVFWRHRRKSYAKHRLRQRIKTDRDDVLQGVDHFKTNILSFQVTIHPQDKLRTVFSNCFQHRFDVFRSGVSPNNRLVVQIAGLCFVLRSLKVNYFDVSENGSESKDRFHIFEQPIELVDWNFSQMINLLASLPGQDVGHRIGHGRILGHHQHDGQHDVIDELNNQLIN